MVSKTRIKFILMALLLVALLTPVLPAAAAPDYQGGVHVVQRGENLSMIAQRYGISQAALAQANGISNPNIIYVGQRLVIPGAGGGGNAGGGGAAAGGIHIVRAGENLSTIAARYGTSTAALARANAISNPNHIYVGQRLVLSASGAGSVPAPAPAPAPSNPVVSNPGNGGGRWIDINLSNQSLTAFEGNTPVFNTLVSTGSTFPTPVGTYRIQYKVRVATDDRSRLRPTQRSLGDVLYQPRPRDPRRLLAQQLRPAHEPRLCQHATLRGGVAVQLHPQRRDGGRPPLGPLLRRLAPRASITKREKRQELSSWRFVFLSAIPAPDFGSRRFSETADPTRKRMLPYCLGDFRSLIYATTSRRRSNCASVFSKPLNPCSNPTRGSYPSSLRASEMSATRRATPGDWLSL